MPAPRTALAIAASVAALATPAALADSTPVGPLPPGPLTTMTAAHGTLVAIAVPRRKASTGLVWRIARTVSPRVLRQVRLAGPNVVLVFRAVGRGRATVVLALTKGDTSAKAVASNTTRVKVTWE